MQKENQEYVDSIVGSTHGDRRVKPVEPEKPAAPSEETLRQWIKNDIMAAHAMISIILQNPELLNLITQAVLKDVAVGSKIDAMPQEDITPK